MAERQEIDLKEAMITLALEVEAILRVLEMKNILTREEVMGEVMILKQEAALKNRQN